MSTNGRYRPEAKAALDGAGGALRKRFYKTAAIEAAGANRWRVVLDGRGIKTPAKRELVVPTEALANALAAEWAAQEAFYSPARLQLTRLVNSAIDGVTGREAEVAADIVKYALSDLICYRAEQPDGLFQRQAELWEPILAWAEASYGTTFIRQHGIMPVVQPPSVADGMATALSGLDAFRLAALHVLTTLMGSAVLAIAVLTGRLTPEAAWSAANIDEDWQIAQWGADEEATARRARRHADLLSAAQLLTLLGVRS